MDKNIIESHKMLKDLHREMIFSRRLDQFNRLFTLGFKAFYEEEKNVRNNLKVLNKPLEWFKNLRNYCFTVLSLFVALITVAIQLNFLTLENAILLISIGASLCYFIPSIWINLLGQKDMKVKQVFNRIKGYWAFVGSYLLTYSAITATHDWRESEEEIDQHVLFAVILLQASTVEMINSLSTVVTPNQLEMWKRSVLSDPYTTEIILSKQDSIKSSHLFKDLKKPLNQYLTFIIENKN
ncbi:hypothetical protein C5S31_04340 [ANME-1 cluster archaeon GoMg2]|nr:hypothetical protein [ANME-1 cluster archaeon GoMg2]